MSAQTSNSATTLSQTVVDLPTTADNVSYSSSYPGGHYSSVNVSPSVNKIVHSYSYSPGFGSSNDSYNTSLSFNTSSIPADFTSATLYIDLTSITPGSMTAAWIGNSSFNLLSDQPGWVAIDVTSQVTAGGTVTFNSSFSGPGGASGLDVEFAAVGALAPYLEVVSCFLQGTHIRIPKGWKRVEDLLAGDLVMTERGEAVPVIWMGYRQIDCTRHIAPESVLPIRIEPHAFGPNKPERALFLSPEHAVATHGVLIPAHALINGTTIRQVDATRITYWHVELAQHDVILAEGLPVESYLENGNRADFDGGDVVALHPLFAGSPRSSGGDWPVPCAEIVTQGAVLAMVCTMLDEIADEVGGGAASSRAVLHE